MGSPLVAHVGPTLAAYMGPLCAGHVGPTWGVQPGFVRVTCSPYGTHIGSLYGYGARGISSPVQCHQHIATFPASS